MRREAEFKARLRNHKRAPHVRLAAVLAIALAAAFVTWLVVRSGDHSSTATPAATSKAGAGKAIPTRAGTGPAAVSPTGLKRFAAAIGHPIYWAGRPADIGGT